MRTIQVGAVCLTDCTEITDPKYNKEVIWRLSADTKPGMYRCYLLIDNNGNIKGSAVVHEDYVSQGKDYFSYRSFKIIGVVGCDSGLCGFFSDKPDYNPQKWHDFIRAYDRSQLSFGVLNKTEYGNGFFSDNWFHRGPATVYGEVVNGKFVSLILDYEDEETIYPAESINEQEEKE